MEENISYIDSLILSFLKEEITGSDRKTLEDWINSTDANKEHFKAIYRIWDAALKTDDEIEMVLQKVKHRLDSNLPESKRVPDKYILTIVKWAAVVIISCLTGALGYKYFFNAYAPKNMVANIIQVPLGSKSNIVLPDGTEVTLNAGSRLTYGVDYGVKAREVNLVGEGYFKVAENKKVPFLVNTVKATIKALGTEFNVKAYPEEGMIETVLVKGSVLVNEILSDEEKRTAKRKTVILTPGQKALIFKGVEKTTVKAREDINKPQLNVLPKNTKMPEMIISKTEAETETSWKDERWFIKGMDLENLAVVLSRRFNVSIQLQDEDLKQYRFSGTIETETVEEVFDIMKYTLPVSYTIEKGKVVWTINRNLEKVYKEAY